MCNCNNNGCACVKYDGSKLIYTGVNIASPFSVPRGTTFNEFVNDLMDYLEDIIPIPQQFNYYWGEIGNIFAADPSGISQSNWDNQIKPDGTSDNMSFYTDSELLSSFEKTSTSNPMQWWIILVPSSETNIVNQLSNYTWYTWDVLTSSWYVFNEHTPYTGTVTLDNVEYTYSAIRPNASNRIKFSNP